MNGFYKVKSNLYGDDIEYSGIVFGEDEADMMRKIVQIYDGPVQISFWFSENFDSDIIEINDFKDCPLFDFH